MDRRNYTNLVSANIENGEFINLVCAGKHRSQLSEISKTVLLH